MNQFDFVGNMPPAPPFKDIRNTRPSAAEEKAALCLELGRLCQKCPASVASGSINLTRNWVAAQKQARKIVANSRSSVAELSSAISNMMSFL